MKIQIDSIEACILDMDGVVTDTAGVHEKAWKRLFDDFLSLRAAGRGEDFIPFGHEDYRRYVDGKPRGDGIASFLAARGISLPYGGPEDSPEEETVCGLGNRKNTYFLELLDREGVTAFVSTVDFVRRGRTEGLRFALISASRNALRVLAAAGLGGLFQVVVDGRDAAKSKLSGKPAPDIFLEAAARLGVRPERAMVVEDARSGVRAGKAGGFGLVVGIDRRGSGEELRRCGADLVVADLAELILSGRAAQDSPGWVSALEETQSIFARLQKELPAIFLDFDGTLAPIVDDPAKAALPSATREVLQRLARHMFVAILSGRSLADIRGKVGLGELRYAGSHGFEIGGGGGYFDRGGGDSDPARYLAALEAAAEELGEAARDLADIRIERKPFAIAVHYRNAGPAAIAAIERRVDGLAGRFGELRKTSGHKIFELRPAVAWDKGRALQALLDRFHLDCSRITPIYIGDDTTDEDAFKSLGGGGISILVSEEPRPTAARYVLRNPEEVALFLEKMASLVERELVRGIWSLTYEGYEPESERLREAICTLGNGLFATRGASPQAVAGPDHYPGTYLAGCYNRLWSEVAGQSIENESLVNIPNWLPLTFRLEGGPWCSTETMEAREYRQELDMAAGLLLRSVCFRDGQGREIRLSERRFVSMAQPHLAGLETVIEVAGWSGRLQVRSALDGGVANTLVDRYRELNNDHLEAEEAGGSEGGQIIWLAARTRQSRIRIALAARTRCCIDGTGIPKTEHRLVRGETSIAWEAILPVREGQQVRLEKIAAIYNSRDRAISESLGEARLQVAHAADFGTLLGEHRRAWRHLWRRCGLSLETTGHRIPQILNLHIFHLLQTVSVHAIDLDVGIPPRGLHGEAYRGLIMWDELFAFPFINLRIPDLTRALLEYRYRRLPHARMAARAAGLAGAMFPWQSGSNGREEAQALHLNPRSGRWIRDHTQLQRHINLAVAYNVWLYYQVSGDLDFLSFYGAELILEIARFWAGLARFDSSASRYEIRGVMGPDEFHVGYPDAKEPGLANNAYTNVMVAWLFCRALEMLELLPEERRQAICENLGIRDRELALWEDISRRMRIAFHDDGIISQFEGYERLAEFDWQRYRKKYGDIHRLDRILEAEGDSTDRYKFSKQADVLMLFYLLSADELRQLFHRLGYPFDHEAIPRNIDYYLQRTSHGSTLSRVVHAWVLARSRRRESWNLFQEALNSDISDIQGGTTHEGIHLGAMAGVVDLVQRCYTGLETRQETLRFNPALPEEVRRLEFNILYRRHWLKVAVEKERMSVLSLSDKAAPIRLGIVDHIYELPPGGRIEQGLRR